MTTTTSDRSTAPKTKGFKILLIIASIMTAIIIVVGAIAAALYIKTDGFTADMADPIPVEVEQPFGDFASHQYQKQISTGAWDDAVLLAEVEGFETCTIHNGGILLVTATDGNEFFSVTVAQSPEGWLQQAVSHDSSSQLWDLCGGETVGAVTVQAPTTLESVWSFIFSTVPAEEVEPDM